MADTQAPDYTAWNDALADWFFPPDAGGRPAYLTLDDEVLAEVALNQGWELDDPLSAFERAVRTYVPPSHPFMLFVQRAKAWLKEDAQTRGNPPFVAILAATVLAVTKSNDLSGARSHNYHQPMAEILGVENSASYYADYREWVPWLWQQLAEWMVGLQGHRGTPTAWAPETYWMLIGFSVSQALLRAGDRARLSDFFVAIGTAPGAAVDSEELVLRYAQWGRAGGNVPPRVLELLKRTDERKAIGELVARELEAWDGSTRDERGRLVIRVLPRIDLRNQELDYVLDVPERVRLDNANLFGREVALEPGRMHHCPLTVDDLPVGASWRSTFNGVAFSLAWAPVQPFLPRDEVGGYVAVPRTELGRTHLVLADAEHAEMATVFLGHILGAPPKHERRIPLPAGWVLFRDVVASDELADAAGALRCLAPRADMLPHLAGGACVNGQAHDYLHPYAPDLIVPGLEAGLEVRLDGVLLQTVDEHGAVITLAEEGLQLGEHEVMVGSTRLRFSTSELRQTTPVPMTWARHFIDLGNGSLVPKPDVERMDLAATEVVRVSGAAIEAAPGVLPPNDPPLMIKEAHRGYLVVGVDGRSALVEPPSPRWLRGVNLFACSHPLGELESLAGFPAAWVVRLLQSEGMALQVRPDAAKAPGVTTPVAVVDALKARQIHVADPGVGLDWQAIEKQLVADD